MVECGDLVVYPSSTLSLCKRAWAIVHDLYMAVVSDCLALPILLHLPHCAEHGMVVFVPGIAWKQANISLACSLAVCGMVQKEPLLSLPTLVRRE